MNIIYKIVNPVIASMLRNSFHSVLSKSIMLITYTGRKSGKVFTTPVRYVKYGETVLCFTSPKIRWWHNFKESAESTLLIEGREEKYQTVVIASDSPMAKAYLQHYFSLFPKDVIVYGIKLNKDKSLSDAALKKAAKNMIIVESTPLT